MEQTRDQKEGEASPKKKQSVWRRIALGGIILSALIVAFFVAAIVYNNVDFRSDAAFSKRLDAAIRQGEGWVGQHKSTILETKNAALLTMLRECNDLRAEPVFAEVVASFLHEPIRHYSRCWKHEVDPNWPVDKQELNMTIAKENIDNKWALYAIAPEKADIDPEKMGLFEPARWQRRQLTHQLFALTILKGKKTEDKKIDGLIEHLCGRLNNELIFDVAVVDIYIQKVAFVLRAGRPEMIRRRWVERIIANQMPDGGWNDRWFCFASGRRPVFGFARPPSDQHATIQAVMALYLVKYRYAEQFGVE